MVIDIETIKPEIHSDGVTVWVNGQLCLGRFGTFAFGIYASNKSKHREIVDNGLEETTLEDWAEFKEKMLKYHGVKILNRYIPKRLRK